MLEITSAEGSYGGIRALRGFTLSVPAGSTIALLGRNGAGKSTALKIMSGGLLPSAGDVTWDGSSIASMPPEERVRLGIALVPEGRGIFPGLTVEENLRMGAYSHKPKRKELDRRLEVAYGQLPDLVRLRKQLAGGLSGGQQQMLTVARALAGEPRVLLLDEPSLGLAPLVVEQLYALFASLAGGDLSIVLVEQYIGFALKLCDYTLVLSNGEVVVQGRSADLVEQNALSEIYLG
jgi:branched-chain amino acid transport system ATP-binding protein